jgi:hypothetical protein
MKNIELTERATKSVSMMTAAEIESELISLGRRWRKFREDCEGGGSPGEWMVERMDELETEQGIRQNRSAEQIQ